MTNPAESPVRFIDGEPPRITRAQTARGLAAMQALLAASELLVGDELAWDERGQRHIAVVLADGRLVVGGDVVSSPSAAGERVGNRRPSGWDCWVCLRDGETLAVKRDRIGLDPR